MGTRRHPVPLFPDAREVPDTAETERNAVLGLILALGEMGLVDDALCERAVLEFRKRRGRRDAHGKRQ